MCDYGVRIITVVRHLDKSNLKSRCHVSLGTGLMPGTAFGLIPAYADCGHVNL
jgi:hypothetical protein